MSPEKKVDATPAAPSVESLMKRGKLFLEDSDWKQANEYFNKVLDIDPEYAPAYVGKLCAELKVQQEEILGNYKEPISEIGNFQKAIRFADVSYRAKVEGYNNTIHEHIEKEGREEQERILRLPELRKKNIKFLNCLSTGGSCTVGLKVDGTVVAVGDNENGQCNTESWQDIVSVASGGGHIVGLKADGTVVAVGSISNGQCNTKSWRDIVSVAPGGEHTVGLKVDGMVVAVGNNDKGQCNTRSWRDIVSVAVGYKHTIGLKADGTVIVAGKYDTGVINSKTMDTEFSEFDVSEWRDIVSVAADSDHIVGLKTDGTVVAVGKDDRGQCNTGSWRDIVSIAVGGSHTVGLKADGTVVTVGKYLSDFNAKKMEFLDSKFNVSGWRDIVAVATFNLHMVGLKVDGTVIAAGNNGEGRCDIGSWQDIVSVNAKFHTVGLKADGTVVAVGRNDKGQCNTESWRDIGPIPEEKRRVMEEEGKRRLEQSDKWVSQGLCKYCGGKLGGLFTKKCKSCGKVN